MAASNCWFDVLYSKDTARNSLLITSSDASSLGYRNWCSKWVYLTKPLIGVLNVTEEVEEEEEEEEEEEREREREQVYCCL